MKPIMRPYTPKTPSSAFSSKKRPSKPQSGASKSKSKHVTPQHDKVLVERQSDGATEDSWTAAAVDELTKLESEMFEKGAGGFSSAVEPDDGAMIVDDPTYEDPDGTNSASSSSSGSSDEAKVEDLPLKSTSAVANKEVEEEEEDLEPTVLPAGPTRARPMEAKPNAIVFFHIPLQEAYTSAIDVAPSGKGRLHVGERLEGAGASKTNSGFFDQAVLAQGELLAAPTQDAVVDEFWDGEYSAPTTGRPEVKVLAHGHCHLSSVSLSHLDLLYRHIQS